MVWLIEATRGYDLTSEPQTLETLENTFILICQCKIYPCYSHIHFYLSVFFNCYHTLNAFVPYAYVVTHML